MTGFRNKFNIEYFVQLCTDIFGHKFNEPLLDKSVIRTNIHYGELHPCTNNIIYVHGSLDPWHTLGLTNESNYQMPTIYIEGSPERNWEIFC